MKKIWLGILLSISVICCAIAVGCTRRGPQILAAPTNFRVENNVLIWDEVEHAQGYAFYFFEMEGETKNNFFDFSEFPWYQPFEVEVLSIGDGEKYLDSYWTKYTCLLVDPSYDLSFELTDDETGYRVVFQDGMKFHEELYIPDEYNGLPVKEIIRRGTPYTAMLQRVRLPETLERIGAGTFSGFTSLQRIEIPKGVSTIAAKTFYGCTSLTGVDFPEGLETIENEAFYGCSRLRAAYFPATLQKIGAHAFEGCIRLIVAEFSSAVEIQSYAFDGCASLIDLCFSAGTEICLQAFKDCTALMTVKCAEGVRITDALIWPQFEGCTALKWVDCSKCSYIGSRAFAGCSALTDIIFPEDPSVYRLDAFTETAWYQNQPNGFVIVNGDTLFRYKGEVPNGGVIDNFPAQIKKIAPNAFGPASVLGNVGSNLVSIEIPDGVQLMGPLIFAYCRSLQYVKLPNDLSVIPEYTFEYCSALEAIEIPASVKVIKRAAFDGCTALQSVQMSEGDTEIGDDAFAICTALQSIKIPEGVTKIGKRAFQRCESLTEITLPSTLEEIGTSAFDGCSSLTKLHFPDSIQTSGITWISATIQEVILPVTMNNVTWFGAETIVYYRGSEERWKEDFPNVRGGIWYFYVEDEADLPQDGGNYWHFAPDGKTPVIW